MSRNDSFNTRKITAVLCAIALLISFVMFCVSKPAAIVNAKKEPIEKAKESIANIEENLEKSQQMIDTLTQQLESTDDQKPVLQAAYLDAEEAVNAAKDELLSAQNALKKVCTRSSYGTKCKNSCKSLHAAVDEKEAAYYEAKAYAEECKEKLDNYNDLPSMLLSQISAAQKSHEGLEIRLAEAEERLAELKSDMAGDRFALTCKVLGIILAIGGLGLLAKILFQEEETDTTLLISCGAIAASALLFFIGTAIGSGISFFAYLFLSPYAYTILAMAMFVRIIRLQADRPVVCRTVAIVALVVATLVSAASIGVVAEVVFAATMIWLAFVIEPLVFTEYINIAKHIFLTLITFGIWMLVWTYHVTKNLNKVNGVDWRNGKNELLLCLFLPFFYPYWFFKTGEYVEAYGQEKAKSVNLEVLALVFAFICPLFSTVLIQNKINVVAGKAEQVECEATGC